MNLVLHLPPETEAKLKEQAALHGSDPESFALEALQDKLSHDVAASPALPYDQWKAEFDAWIASHPRLNVTLDDSRESIYEGRGE